MTHIIVIRDTKFWLIGPFTDEEKAADYGHAHYSPGGPDDPRWQTIDLPDLGQFIGAQCYTPDEAYTLPDNDILNNFSLGD